MLDRLRAKATERYLYKVVEPEATLRVAPHLGAQEIGILEFGQVVLLCELQDGWARLHDDEVWASGLVPPDREGGNGCQMPLMPEPHVFVLVDGQASSLPRYLRREHVPLDEWEYTEAVQCAEANGVPWRRRPGGLRPKSLLDLAWLSPWHSPDGTVMEAPELHYDVIWGNPLPRLCVASMVRGVTAVALESLILHHFSSGFERVLLYFDKPYDPGEFQAMNAVEKFAQPRPLGPGGLMCTARGIRCNSPWWKEARDASRFYKRQGQPNKLYSDVVLLDSEVKDVQARQQVAIEHALFEAQRDGFDWLLHIDADEVLFCPDEERHADARKFFHEVPCHFTAVRFPNLEAVPERFDIPDPFEEVTLFKMNPTLLSELGVEPRILWNGEVAIEDVERPSDLFDMRHASAVPGAPRQLEYARMPRTARHALRRLLGCMHDIAAKRAPALEKLGVTLPEDKFEANHDNDPDFSDDESCYGPRPHVPSFFNSYSNGKAAVRTHVGPQGELPPIPAGVHGFVRDTGGALYELECKGPGAPVVLHYSNCGYDNWRKKYSILCKDHGTEDGAFSTEREGIKGVRSHIAARQLTLRGSEADLLDFYRTFVQGNEYDEMAYLAQFGIVLRLEAPQRKLREARRRLEALPPLPPKEKCTAKPVAEASIERRNALKTDEAATEPPAFLPPAKEQERHVSGISALATSEVG